ncbi:MAG: hypothetical protein M1834_002701 [Cirrosporium novae-zelandiae]|nr:MAG: hypothetical protein M1834_002701 [Cirrosporium novae-zelandiae]
MVAVRPFKPNDLFHLNLTNLDPLVENYQLNFYLEYLGKWPSLLQVVEDKGQIVGYIMGKVEEQPKSMALSEHYTPWHGHITALTIAPSYRRQGLARLLTKSFEKACNEQDAWFVDLYVRESNEVAINLYKSMGYSVFRRVVGYYAKPDEDGFDMRKPLDRDKDHKHIRENGENFRVNPEDVS